MYSDAFGLCELFSNVYCLYGVGGISPLTSSTVARELQLEQRGVHCRLFFLAEECVCHCADPCHQCDLQGARL